MGQLWARMPLNIHLECSTLLFFIYRASGTAVDTDAPYIHLECSIYAGLYRTVYIYRLLHRKTDPTDYRMASTLKRSFGWWTCEVAQVGVGLLFAAYRFREQ